MGNRLIIVANSDNKMVGFTRLCDFLKLRCFAFIQMLSMTFRWCFNYGISLDFVIFVQDLFYFYGITCFMFFHPMSIACGSGMFITRQS